MAKKDSSTQLRDKALHLEMKKHYQEAAKIYEGLKDFDKAAYLYSKANQIEKSAKLLFKAGKVNKAADLFFRLDMFAEAANLYEKSEDFRSAARCYVRNGQLEKASLFFEKAEDYEEAARINIVLRNFMKAGELFEKAGNLIQSAKAYEMMIDVQQARTVEQKSDRDRIAGILMKVKRFEKAAEIYIQSQEITEAIQMYLKVNDVPAAARLYSNCQGDIGIEVLESINMEDEILINNVIKMFELSKDFNSAGKLCERLEKHFEAGKYYYHSGQFESAAEMFLEAGKTEQAAAMYVKAGDLLTAGRLFMKAGMEKQAALCFENGLFYFDAGKLYAQLDRYDKAVELLQKIPSSDEHFLQASEIISEIFSKKGMMDLAIQRYRKVVEETSLNEQSVQFYYRLAMIFKEKGAFQEAINLLQTVVSFDPQYKDARSCLLELGKRMKKTQEMLKQEGSVAAPQFEETVDWEEAANENADALAAHQQQSLKSRLVSRMEGFEFLRRMSLFEELNLQELKIIYSICETKSFEKGQIVLKEDTPGVTFYIIKKGSVTVRKNSEDGGEEILAHLLPGEHFGEMSVMETVNTSANVVAEEEVELFTISREDFHKILEANDRIATKIYRALIKTLSQRLRISSDKVAYLKSSLDSARAN